MTQYGVSFRFDLITSALAIVRASNPPFYRAGSANNVLFSPLRRRFTRYADCSRLSGSSPAFSTVSSILNTCSVLRPFLPAPA